MVSYLHSQLGFFCKVPQPLWLVDIPVFGAVGYPPVPFMSVNFGKSNLNKLDCEFDKMENDFYLFVYYYVNIY